MATTATRNTTWIYLPGNCGLTETALWQGECSAPLAPHMHDETQVSVVLTGRRRFATPFGLIQAGAGETIIMGAGVPHQALGLSEKTLALNYYVNMFNVDWGVSVIPTPHQLSDDQGPSPTFLTMWLENLQGVHDPLARERKVFADLVRGDTPIAALARECGLARESFARSFQRLIGVPPSVFRVSARLNIARAALRRGVRPAEAAADADFADQSHLGRTFRAAFGTTPGSYRRVFTN